MNQTIGENPSDLAIQANRPESGFISRFFQTSALTVGMTKNGAITMSRSRFWPNTGWSINSATRMPPMTLIASTEMTSTSVLISAAMKFGSDRNAV